MRRVVAVALAFVALGGAMARVDAAGCVKKKGDKLFSRDACRKSERPLDTTTLVPVGPIGPAGPGGEPAKFPLMIVDASDREIGPV